MRTAAVAFLLLPSIAAAEIVETNFVSVAVERNMVSEGDPLYVTQASGFIFATSKTGDTISRLDTGGKPDLTAPLPTYREPDNDFNWVLAMTSAPDAVYVAVGNGSESDCAKVFVWRYALDLSAQQKVFESTPCLSGETFWHLGMAVRGHELLLSGTNLFTDTSTGQQPAPNVDYENDTTNFYGQVTAVDTTTLDVRSIATGIRGLAALVWDSKRNVLWNTDNGPRGGDELNVIQEGADYGWPNVTLGRLYATDEEYPDGVKINTTEGATVPVFGWTPSIAPSTVILSTGEEFPHWQDDLLVGSLKGAAIRRLRVGSQTRVLYDEEIQLGVRIRSMATTQDGKIILGTDGGELITLSNADRQVHGVFPPLPD